MNKRPEISLVVPVLNEEPIVPELVARSIAALSAISPDMEMILVDDGSTDGTLAAIKAERARDPRVRFISLSRNFGHQMAITAGLDAAQGNTVAIMDGDLQDPPEVIPELYARYKEGYQVVYAKRRNRLNEVFWKKWAAAVFYRLLRSIVPFDIPLDTGDFRLISRKVLLRLGDMRERDRFLRGQIAWLGFKTALVHYDRHGRAAGERKYTLRKLVHLAMAGVLSFSSFPLRLASFFGFFVSLLAFGIILYALWSKLTQGDLISGWTSLIVSAMFIGGVQLICLGIIGEYINRISQEVRQRPMYVVVENSEDQESLA
jgi:glycosyltransferase involved in cell wall biosynthesis